MADKKWSEVDKISSFSDCARLPILDTKCCDPESEDNILTNYTIAVQDFLNGVNIKISKLEEDCSTVQEQIAQIEQNIEDITQADFDEKIRQIDEKLDEAEQTLADIQSALDSNAYVKYTDIRHNVSEITDCSKEVPSMCLILGLNNSVQGNTQSITTLRNNVATINLAIGALQTNINNLIISANSLQNFKNRNDVTAPYTRSFVFDTKAELDTQLESSSFIENLREGDAFYITAAGSQDYYWDGHQIQPIENPTDLSDYVTKEELQEVVDNETSHYGRYVGYNLQAQVEDFQAQVTQPHSEVFNDYQMVYNETTKEFETNNSYGGQKITDDYSTAHGKGNQVGEQTYGQVTVSSTVPVDGCISLVYQGQDNLSGKYAYLNGIAYDGNDKEQDISGYYKLTYEGQNIYTIYISTSYQYIVPTSDILSVVLIDVDESEGNHVSGKDNIVQGSNQSVSGFENQVSGQFNIVGGYNNTALSIYNSIVGGSSNVVYKPNKSFVTSNAQGIKNSIIIGNNNYVDTEWGTNDIKYVQVFGENNTVLDNSSCLVGGRGNLVKQNINYTSDAIIYGYKNYCSASYTNIFGRFNQYKAGSPNGGLVDSFIAGTNNFTLNINETAFGVRNVSFNPTEKDPNYEASPNTVIVYDDPDHEESIFTIGNGDIIQYDEPDIPSASVYQHNRNAIAITRYIKQTPISGQNPYEETKAGVYVWYKDKFRSIQSILNELEQKNTELEQKNTKLENKIPDCPTATDGTFTLTCTVTGGVPTYSWV